MYPFNLTLAVKRQLTPYIWELQPVREIIQTYNWT